MEPIRLLYVIRPAAGGMREHLFNLVGGLDPSLYRITVACPPDEGMVSRLKKLGVQVRTFALKGELSPWSDWKATLFLRRLIQAEGIQLVHVHGFKASLVARIAAGSRRMGKRPKRNRPRVVYTVHNFIFGEGGKGLKRRLYILLETFLAPRTDKIITVSRALEEDLSRLGVPSNKIVAIYNGIDTSRFSRARNPEVRTRKRSEMGLTSDHFVVGTIARLISSKGVGCLLEAASVVLDRIPGAVFVIVGDGPQRQELQNKAAGLGIGGAVRFLGFREDVPELLGAFDLFVLPSLSEGMAITLVEAMAAGRPVVASRTGGIVEVVEDGKTGLLAPPGESGALAGAILRLHDDPGKAAEFVAAGQRRVEEKFTLEAMLRQTQEVYRSVLE
ncbi:MAG: glycosyltransferase family 4 protein [Syntrophothermus sp.]